MLNPIFEYEFWYKVFFKNLKMVSKKQWMDSAIKEA